MSEPYRDPAAVCAAILRAMAIDPANRHLRVGQMLVNAVGTRDLFYVEDADLAEAVDRFGRGNEP